MTRKSHGRNSAFLEGQFSARNARSAASCTRSCADWLLEVSACAYARNSGNKLVSEEVIDMLQLCAILSSRQRVDARLFIRCDAMGNC